MDETALNNDNHALSWYCFRTLPKKEQLASGGVRRRAALETFCPRVSYHKKTRRGKQRFTEALFPGYLFVRCDIVRDLRHVRAIHGVRTPVCYGEYIPRIPDGFIACWQEKISGEAMDIPDPVLEAGSEVVILEGPLADFSAIVNGFVPARSRVRLLLEFLGRQLTVDLPSGAVLAKDSAPRASLRGW